MDIDVFAVYISVISVAFRTQTGIGESHHLDSEQQSHAVHELAILDIHSS